MGREDCLTLEVRTPALAPSVPLPVMVWIHGGGNRAGSGMGTIDSDIVRKGFVLVDFNYRLVALGFLSHPALSAEAIGREKRFATRSRSTETRDRGPIRRSSGHLEPK